MLKKGIAAISALFLFQAGAAFAEDAGAKIEFKPRLSGYVEGWFRSDGSGLSNQTTGAKKVDNEFRVRRARLTASGDLNDEISYKIAAALDGPAPGASYSVKLYDGWLSYRFTDAAKVTFGQFKYDFTLEGVENTPERTSVLRAESINEIAGKLGTRGGSFRDIGVRLSGVFRNALGLTYGVSIINGNGINTGDNNGEKDVAGRVTVTPVHGLTIGASGYKGTGQDEDVQSVEVKETAWGADVQYELEGLRLRAEYVAGEWKNWNPATAAAASGVSQKPNGWYAQASYRLPFLKNAELLGRYEDFEWDANTADSHLKTTTVGATWYLKGKTRITANYLFRDAGGSPIVLAQETNAKGGNIGNLLLLQAIAVF